MGQLEGDQQFHNQSAPGLDFNKRPYGRSWKMTCSWLLIVIVSGFTLLYYAAPALTGVRLVVSTKDIRKATQLDDPDLSMIWKEIIPNVNLTWTACFGTKECAKLAVPLDYNNLSGPKAAIALLRVPAKVSTSDDRYRGPVLVNPGGPGGSGVDLALGAGEYLQTIIGDEHDIVGFDPRGVGLSSPKMEAFKDYDEWATWTLRFADIPPLGSTADAVGRHFARASVFGALASARLGEAAQYVSTAYVARDMLRITEEHGFEKLKYIGYSYGSVLGITFASMFPNHVERLVVDGVVDTEDYYQAQWANNLRDTDASLYMFYQTCSEAGPAGCALYEPTANAVKARTERIFASIKAQPLALLSTSNGTSASDYGVMDYQAIQLATALVGIEQRNGKPFNDLVLKITAGYQVKCNCDQKQNPLVFTEATLAVACSDGDVVDDSVEDLEAHYQRMAKLSTFADMWAIRIACSGWKIRAKERFRGPWAGNTSFPMLFIGNTADPVTALWNAHKMVKGFKDAVVLEQKSGGHTSLAAVSLCTCKTLRGYFRDGKLPEHGTKCDTESRIFGQSTTSPPSLTSEDRELFEASRELSRKYRPPRFHAGWNLNA